jgi:hypothetical protein
VIDYIISIFDVDAQGALVSCRFVASNLENLLKYGLEETVLASVVERQLRTKATVRDVTTAVAQIAASRPSSTASLDTETTSHMVAELQQKLEAFSSSVCARFDQLNNVYS